MKFFLWFLLAKREVMGSMGWRGAAPTTPMGLRVQPTEAWRTREYATEQQH